MKKFNVTVNGKTYAVEVEEVSGAQGFTYVPVQQQTPVQSASVQQPIAAPQAAPQQAPIEKPEAPKAEPLGDGGILMSAPMPGTILDIMVNEGQRVNKGETIIILEAMKMENEIVASVDGIIKKIYTSKSAIVNAGDPMLTIA